MQILSSKFSFVDFNEPPESCNQEVMPLPAVTDFGIKFQFIVRDAPEGAEFWIVPYNGVALTDAKVQATVICGVLTSLIMHANVPAVEMYPYLAMYDCFQYALYLGDPEADGELIALSNPFQVVPPSCWLSKIDYWSNENYADFTYMDDVKTNSIWLYMHLRNPTNPTKEVRYIESTGRKRLLSSILDEDYELKTDAFTQWLHRKIECALLHDYIKFTNSNVGIVDEVLAKNATYSKDWQEDVPGVNIASAKCRMIKNLSFTNSNCGEVDCACTQPPVAIDYTYEIYTDEVTSKRTGALLIGNTSEGTLTIVPGVFATDHGSITLNADGSFIYTPAAGYTGADTIDYELKNECGTATGTITFNIKNMEPGFIMEWGGLPSAIPSGWLLCDGSAVSRVLYAPLFIAIGVLHGTGNGTTTFNLPTIKQRGVVGYDAAVAPYDAVGYSGGANEITLEEGQLPKHRVKVAAEADSSLLNVAWPAAPRAIARKTTTESSNAEYRFDPAGPGVDANIGDSSEVGNDDPIDIRNAFVVLPYIIKT